MSDNKVARLAINLYLAEVSNANDIVLDRLRGLDSETLQKYIVLQLANLKRKSPEKYNDMTEKIDTLSNLLDISGVD